MNVTPTETRVGVVENGMLAEVYIERASSRGIVGNIYKGKVVRVLPGMQAAFIDIGLDKAGFIHAADIDRGRTEGNEKKSVENIALLVREGQSIVVQVTKDPISTKGARLTTHMSIPSRYLVYMPNTQHVGISQRIEEDEERERLRSLVEASVKQEGLEGKGGFILRTAAEGAGSDEILSDTKYLRRLWEKVQKRMKTSAVPSEIYGELSLSKRTIRDLLRPEVNKILIDSKETFNMLSEFTEDFVPEHIARLEHYTGERPIFELNSVEDEIKRALDKKVLLKSGGYLIIDKNEAMKTIDVNTGGFVGHRNLEETIFKTNLEAASAIARQLRLRNLGGIIILDFIDMLDVEHQRQVHRLLEKNLEKDHAKTKISGVSDLGLVEMTRKRTRESLEHVLCSECEVCNGRGYVKSVETICAELLREIVRVNRAYDADKFIVYASTAVAESLESDEFHNLAELEVFIGKQIKVKTESLYNQDQFDVVMM
jgi:ribonuclease G